MALSFSPTNITFHNTPKLSTISTTNAPKFTQFAHRPLKFTTIAKATQEDENTPTSENIPDPPKAQSDEMTDLGMELKKAMKEREGQNEETGFLSGVAEEIREIEWPAFNKVLGTTGAVLGVIAGSSVVLLTVNAVLAELSDRVFAGKGVQDFFG
ncbi:hypothetical protein BUALT_Bualt14G0093400 [Buddleja alternifolia]|uniref:Preprotein translocase subunit SECE1 n=1 Tax=Buddleja alternifolia TaxID=168488 RepID=A0AAV6WT96_9LAMI|nr:hypothetical protein BUALT_Bualt14G0093400 [Buddleja alternifolia]